MHFPEFRARRSRRRPAIRRLLQETFVTPADLIAPLFVVPGENVNCPAEHLPGVACYSVDQLQQPIDDLTEAGVGSVLLFGAARQRDDLARDAVAADAAVNLAVDKIKQHRSDFVVITDVGISAYTSHGHSGIIENGEVDNDSTLELLAEMALIHARAGADFVSPSASMDGQVGFIRETLDEEGHDQTGIIGCTLRYRSAYGAAAAPVLEADDPVDRSTYQVEPGNLREAMREATQDIEEGADMLMIKPVLAYLDVLARIYDNHKLPLVGFCSSGEYQLIEAAAERGWIDRDAMLLENLTAIKRAGAQGIVSYHALHAAKLLA